MQTAKIFTNGSSQAVRLPKEYRFNESEVYIQKSGDVVILVPKSKQWETFLEGISGFTDDYFSAMENRRIDEISSERESQ